MRKYLFLTLLMSFSTGLVRAQQDLFCSSHIISPEINKDNTTTFRLVAPNAKEVKLSVDWMPIEGFVRLRSITSKQ